MVVVDDNGLDSARHIVDAGDLAFYKIQLFDAFIFKDREIDFARERGVDETFCAEDGFAIIYT
jgi:hypothetical protein